MSNPRDAVAVKPRRVFLIRLRHDRGHDNWTIGHHDNARDAVAFLLADQLAPQRAVVWVKQRPVCDYCTESATRYDRDSGDPLCWSHAVEHNDTATGAREATGKLGVRRFELVEPSEWEATT